ncbi:peptidase [Halobacillus fulvus]|nr:peptidase [Halobacillus fulvus]
MRFLLLFALLVSLTGFAPPEPTDEVTIIVELDQSPQSFVDEIESRLPRIEVVAQYDTIFNGVALKGKAKELEKVARMGTVMNQYPVHTYQILTEDVDSFTTDKIRSNLRSSFTGKGVKVGIIDTGIDYTHPDLMKNYRGGFDTVDFDEDPMETLEEGATLHGSHVAGVVGADGKMKGIAPDVDLYAYRALGPGGMGSSVQVIAAIEEAVEDGMDIINLSLGNAVNGPDWPTTHAVNKAIELGTTVVVAAGNSGPDNWTVGSPATSSGAITVGAAALPGDVPKLLIPGVRQQIDLQPLAGSKPWNLTKKYPVYYAGTGEEEMGSAKGKIVLFKRGVVPFHEKAWKAYKKGAEAVLIFNNEKGLFQGSLDGLSLPIPVAAISQKSGELILAEAVEQNQWVATNEERTAQQVAPFSSRGPVTTTWEMKPDLLAPGTDVWSTVPGGFASLQGTSMAAPHIAGIAALMKEAHPDWTPEDMKQALISGADILDKANPIEQGSGMVDIEESVTPKLLMDKRSFSLGKIDQSFFKKTESVTLKNETDSDMDISFERPALEPGESWRLPAAFELKAGETTEIEIGIGLTKAFLKEGIHQGYLKLKAGEQIYELPYLYVNQESDYEKVSGFELTRAWDDPKRYEYRFHLSEDADQIMIDLYRAGTMLHEGQIVTEKKVRAGMQEGEVQVEGLSGPYIAAVTVVHNKETFSYSFPVLLPSD